MDKGKNLLKKSGKGIGNSLSKHFGDTTIGKGVKATGKGISKGKELLGKGVKAGQKLLTRGSLKVFGKGATKLAGKGLKFLGKAAGPVSTAL